MGASVAEPAAARHRTLSEIGRPRMAKADLTKRENDEIEAEYRGKVGHAVELAFARCGWSVKEAADKVGRDRAQVSRWIAGTERPQLDALFAVPALRKPLVIELANLAKDDGVEVTTHISIPV